MVAILSASSLTTGRFSARPTARIDACGGLITASKRAMPDMPRLGMVGGAPRYSWRGQRLRARAGGQVPHLVGDFRETLHLGIADHRRVQAAAFERHGHGDVRGAMTEQT